MNLYKVEKIPMPDGEELDGAIIVAENIYTAIDLLVNDYRINTVISITEKIDTPNTFEVECEVSCFSIGARFIVSTLCRVDLVKEEILLTSYGV